MKPGYYWAKREGKWIIVEAVRGLHGAVLERGASVTLDKYSEIDPTPITRNAAEQNRRQWGAHSA